MSHGGPLPIPTGPQLYAVSATGGEDVWAVGAETAADAFRESSMVLHYDGTSWSRLDVPDIRRLRDVTAVAPGDVWAIGGGQRILHLAGGRWTIVRLPHVARAQLSAVAGSGPDDVWVVGTRQGAHLPANSIGTHTLTYHWSGTSWSVVSSPNFDHRYNFVSDVLALSPDDAWATAATTHEKYALHWNGSVWRRVDVPSFAQGGTDLSGVGVVHGDQVWVVGASHGIGFGRPLYLHWTGATWQDFRGPRASGTMGTPSAVGGASSDDVWAVGNPNQSDSSIHHFDGTRWRYDNHVRDAGTPFYRLSFTDLAVIAANDAWIVGYAPGPEPTDDRHSPQEALVVHWDGHTWQRVNINACCEAVSAG